MKAVSLLTILLLSLPIPVTSQGVSARLEGLVQDQSHAVIPGVTVTATNSATNLRYDSLTNEVGRYVFVALPPGSYSVTAELPGFKKSTLTGILLQVGDARTLNMTLEAGSVSENVTVVAEAPLMDLTTAKIGAVVESRQILELPLLGRNAMSLFYLQAGTNPLDAAATSQQQRGGVDGLAPNTNNTKVEGIFAGIPSYDYSPSKPAVPMPQEAVGEYRVTTSGALADSGRGSGAQVSVFLKSGGNDFHGSVFEFARNTVLNANNFFNNRAAAPRPPIQRHQFGYSLGGPIVKNKTFFFGTMEWHRQNESVIQNFQVYTPALRTGIFRYNTAGATTTSSVDANGNPRVPFNTIDLLTIDPTRRGMDTYFLPEMLAVMPPPNNYDVGDGLNIAGYRVTSPKPYKAFQWLFKVDHELSGRHHVAVSLSRFRDHATNDPVIDGQPTEQRDELQRAISVRVLSTFTPRLSNEFSIGGNHRETIWPALHPKWETPRGHIILTGLGNGNIFTARAGQNNPAVNLGMADNVNWVKSNHTVSFGGEIWYHTLNRKIGYASGTGPRNTNGIPYPLITTDILDNPANVPALSGLAGADRTRAQQLVNDLTGSVGTLSQTFFLNRREGYNGLMEHNYQQIRQLDASLFVQDIWKIHPRFSLNGGLRYDILPPGWVVNAFVHPIGGPAGALGVQGPTGQPTRWGFVDKGGRSIMRLDKNNFAPRLGFSWDVRGQGKTTLSGSYGIAYDRMMMAVFSNLSTENYSSATAVMLTPMLRMSDPAFQSLLPIPVPTLFAPLGNTRESRAFTVDPEIGTPYVQSWNLRIAQQVATNWKIEATYTGNHAVGQWRAVNFNQIEVQKNGFLDTFKIAQRNLEQSGSPLNGQSLGALDPLFRLIPASQNSLISQGQVGALADYLDTTPAVTGVRGGLVERAGLPATFFRFNPQVQNLNIVGNRNHSTFNALKLAVSRRLQSGFYAQANYTLGKNFTDYITQQALFDGADYRDNARPYLDKRYSEFDSTHALSFNWIYEVPLGNGRTFLPSLPAVAQAFVGGWQLNGIYYFASGRPLRITTGRLTLTANVASTPNFTGEAFDLSKAQKGAQITTLTAEQRAQFSNPGAGEVGDLPLYSFRGPGYSNLDLSLIKNFPLKFIGEAAQAQFRLEFYNALNQVNFDSPAVNINSGNFGVISSAKAARIGQLALKIVF
jgi:hypothetical protein